MSVQSALMKGAFIVSPHLARTKVGGGTPLFRSIPILCPLATASLNHTFTFLDCVPHQIYAILACHKVPTPNPMIVPSSERNTLNTNRMTKSMVTKDIQFSLRGFITKPMRYNRLFNNLRPLKFHSNVCRTN